MTNENNVDIVAVVDPSYVEPEVKEENLLVKLNPTEMAVGAVDLEISNHIEEIEDNIVKMYLKAQYERKLKFSVIPGLKKGEDFNIRIVRKYVRKILTQYLDNISAFVRVEEINNQTKLVIILEFKTNFA